jgi:hypothetical protein
MGRLRLIAGSRIETMPLGAASTKAHRDEPVRHGRDIASKPGGSNL